MLNRIALLLVLTCTLSSARFPLAAQTPQPSRTNASWQNGSAAPRSLAELKDRIQQIVSQPALAPGFFAVKIVSLDTGTVVFEQDANKFVRPASNMKLYTVAAAFDRLTPDYRFITSVYAKEKVEDGKIKGDLIIYGRGDPSIAARFNNGDYFKGINELASRIVAAGVRRVEGDLIGDESYFVGPHYGSGWEWEDLTWYYGAEVTPLTVNDNALDLSWREVFQTDSRAEVENYCLKAGMKLEWNGERQLRTSQVCQAVIEHPLTGEMGVALIRVRAPGTQLSRKSSVRYSRATS